MKAIALYPDSRIEDFDLQSGLEPLQAFVDGYIEIIRFKDKNVVMWVNEEGRLHGMLPNVNASILYGDNIRGKALIVGYRENENVDLPTKWTVEYVKNIINNLRQGV